MARKSKEPHLEWVQRTGDNAWYWEQVEAIAKEIKSDG